MGFFRGLLWRSRAGEPDLFRAAARGDLGQMSSITGAGCDVNRVSRDGWTALLEAVIHDTDVVRLLLARGANPNIGDARGYTPLHRAAAHGNTPVVEQLCLIGASAHATDSSGKTPVDLAVRHGHEETARYLEARMSSPDLARYI